MGLDIKAGSCDHLLMNMNEADFKEFLEKFTDDQVGLEIASVSLRGDNEITVYKHLHHIKESQKLREGRTIAPSGRTFEECDRLAKEEWQIMAEELIEKLDSEKFGFQKWHVYSCSRHGFTLVKD